MDTSYYGLSLIIFILIFLYAFFSAIETSVISSNIIKLKDLSKNSNKRKYNLAINIINNQDKYLSMALVGSNVTSIAAASFIIYLANKYFVLDDYYIILLTVSQTILFLIICELFPKLFARSFPERFLGLTSFIIEIFYLILYPLTILIEKFLAILKVFIKIDDVQRNVISSRDEIDYLFKMSEIEGIINSQHYIYLDEILSFKDVKANEIMTPLIDLVCVEKNQNIKDLIDIIKKTRFSRIPVYEKRVDNIIGYVYYKDILKNKNIKDISQLLRKPYYVPSSKRVYQLLDEMKEKEISIAFVVNEYGAVEGLITDEDIAEEIVGEIQTKDHPLEELIIEIGPKKYSVDGNLDIEYFQRRFGIDIPKKDFETVAGFILYNLGYFPKKGEKFKFNDTTFIIEQATERSIDRVMVQLPATKTKKR